MPDLKLNFRRSSGGHTLFNLPLLRDDQQLPASSSQVPPLERPHNVVGCIAVALV